MSGRAGPARRAVLAAGTLVVGIALAAAAGEAWLRLWRPQAVGLARLPAIYAPDPELGYRYVPGARGRIRRGFELDNRVVINGRGFHDAEWETTPERPILVVGDSFTAALHVPVEDTWTRVAGRRLAERAADAPRVLNLGLDGTGTDVHLALLDEALGRVSPAAVVVAFFENDPADLARGRVFRETRGDYVLQPQDAAQAARMRALADRLLARRTARALFEHVWLCRLGVYLARGDRNLWRTNVISPHHLGATAAPPQPTRGPGPRALFEAFGERAARHGFRLWVVPVPPREAPGRSLQTFRRTVGPGVVEVIDLQPALQAALERDARPFDSLYWRWDAHFNAYGNRVFGEAVADALAARGVGGDGARAVGGDGRSEPGASRMSKTR